MSANNIMAFYIDVFHLCVEATVPGMLTLTLKVQHNADTSTWHASDIKLGKVQAENIYTLYASFHTRLQIHIYLLYLQTSNTRVTCICIIIFDRYT